MMIRTTSGTTTTSAMAPPRGTPGRGSNRGSATVRVRNKRPMEEGETESRRNEQHERTRDEGARVVDGESHHELSRLEIRLGCWR